MDINIQSDVFSGMPSETLNNIVIMSCKVKISAFLSQLITFRISEVLNTACFRNEL
jgi:hypothetical protein